MVVVACRIILSAPVTVPFLFLFGLWTLDSEFGTWIWDLGLRTILIGLAVGGVLFSTLLISSLVLNILFIK